MEERETKSPFKITDEDGLGMTVVKAAAQGFITTIGVYGGMFVAFATIGYVSDKFKSKEEKEEAK